MDIISWQKNQATRGNEYPISREGHTLTYVEGEGIFLFGGFGSKRFKDLYKYNIRKNKWQHFENTTGRHPSARCYHTSFYDAPFLYIYGGQGDKGNSLGDCSVLNIKNLTWKK